LANARAELLQKNVRVVGLTKAFGCTGSQEAKSTRLTFEVDIVNPD